MAITDLQPNSSVEVLEIEVIEVAEAREFTNFRGSGRVASAKAKDSTGEITLTLWNEQIDQVNPGDQLKIENGWVKEYRGELQISTGKFGKLTVVPSEEK